MSRIFPDFVELFCLFVSFYTGVCAPLDFFSSFSSFDSFLSSVCFLSGVFFALSPAGGAGFAFSSPFSGSSKASFSSSSGSPDLAEKEKNVDAY